MCDMKKILFKNFYEIKSIIGALNSANDFDDIRTSLILSTQKIIDLIGDAVYDKALAHYLSNNYSSPTSSDYSENDSALDLLNNLVMHIQRPLVFYAYEKYSAYSDLETSNAGRKMVVTDERKNPFEWMINKYDAGLIRDANTSADELIAFLDKNAASFSEWTNSDNFKLSKSLILNSAKDFNRVYPINNSGRFFIEVLPFIERIELFEIKPRLLSLKYDEVKSEILSMSLSDVNKQIVRLAHMAIVPKVMTEALMKFSINIFPETVISVFKNYTQTLEVNIAKETVNQYLIKMFNNEATYALNTLERYISSLTPVETEQISMTERYINEKFIRL